MSAFEAGWLLLFFTGVYEKRFGGVLAICSGSVVIRLRLIKSIKKTAPNAGKSKYLKTIENRSLTKVTTINFCPKCGTLLQTVKKNGSSLRCPKCKFQTSLKETVLKANLRTGKSIEIAIVDKKAASLRQLPIIKTVCLTCGHNECETWNVETANETIHSTITFFRCTKCGTTTREAG
ncbi:MAG: hypothetical protein M1490_05915 [Candidatus Bathyarchaeota archaeon]|nr:hypothetical protein [Candidatus Bathyarchaeota archaeon]